MLETHRMNCHLVLCYKIIFDIVHLNKHEFFHLANTNTRGHQFKLYEQYSSCSVRSSYLVKELLIFGIGFLLALLILALYTVLETHLIHWM